MLNNLRGVSPGQVSNVAMLVALAELQGLSFSLLPGQSAGVKNPVTAIRPEDTILAAWNNSAGTITDVTGTTTILDTRAVATITLTSVAANDTVVVGGLSYKAVAGVAKDFTEFSVGGTDTQDATALSAAINARENARDTSQVTATSATNVVTVKAVADGSAGNAVTLTKSGSGIAVSGATLSGGTATGGISTVGATNQVILIWANKK
jgi:phage tail sheath gpL-like